MTLCFNLEEEESIKHPLLAMPLSTGGAISHVWMYFSKQPTENPYHIYICTCQICESQDIKQLVLYNFSKGIAFWVFTNDIYIL